MTKRIKANKVKIRTGQYIIIKEGDTEFLGRVKKVLPHTLEAVTHCNGNWDNYLLYRSREFERAKCFVIE